MSLLLFACNNHGSPGNRVAITIAVEPYRFVEMIALYRHEVVDLAGDFPCLQSAWYSLYSKLVLLDTLVKMHVRHARVYKKILMHWRNDNVGGCIKHTNQ